MLSSYKSSRPYGGKFDDAGALATSSGARPRKTPLAGTAKILSDAAAAKREASATPAYLAVHDREHRWRSRGEAAIREEMERALDRWRDRPRPGRVPS